MSFCCFEAFLGEIHRELFFLDIKVTISETMNWNIQKASFLSPCLKGANTEENLDLFKELFMIKPVKGDQLLTKNCFSQQGEPHTAKNIPSLLFWSVFGGNS